MLDISETALERAKKRLGEQASLVKWIAADAATFVPETQYDFWHDRAAFHFLTDEKDIDTYLNRVYNHLSPDGILVIGTFSTEGPKKCSGIEIKQYSENSMTEKLMPYFDKIRCIPVENNTPSGSVQQFVFCSFNKKGK